MIIDGEEWNPPDELEQKWKDFLVAMMANTVRMCRWIAARSRRGIHVRIKSGPSDRMYSAAIAWRWVFWEPESELTLPEVCETLGFSARAVRLKILADCRPAGDINQVVDRIIAAGDSWNAKPKRKAPRPSREVRVDWRGIGSARHCGSDVRGPRRSERPDDAEAGRQLDRRRAAGRDGKGGKRDA